jgi:tripartite-type tricarboxylate transporter receptor subunit TctC
VGLPHRRFLHAAAGVAAAFASIFFSAPCAWSQAERTIKIVVAVPAGGPADIVAHLFADQMSQAFIRAHGPMLQIDTRLLAEGAVGAETVSHAAPNGDTLLMTTNAFMINPYLRQVRYDPLTSFEPVCYLMSSPEVVLVNSASQYRTLGDLLNAARAKPGELTMASFGPAGSAHLAVEMLKLAANVNIRYIPFPNQVLAINAVSGDRVTSAFVAYRAVREYLKDGRLRALATASRRRIDALPDLPTIAESGYADYEAEVRLWLLAPAATPKETISQLAAWFTAAMNAPETKSRLVAEQLYPVGTCGADSAVFLRKQYEDIGRVIRDANIK